METLSYFLMFMIVPLIIGVISKFVLKYTYSWKEFGINLGAVSLMTLVILLAGQFHQFSDTEIWNGKVVSKERIHDHYLDPYDCNCYESCSGSGNNRSCTTICQTCYEDRYTVDWVAKTTVGKITFQSYDRGSKSVYNEPDPKVYKNCKVGDPASRENTYTNYVKAVPESLFNTAMADDTYPVPAYPRVYDFYKINRVINIDSKVSADQIKTLNRMLSDSLIELGKAKQVNFIVILTEIDDPNYRHTVENAWIGGKKNDAVVFIGLDGDTITWADVMTWALNSGNELYNATMKTELSSLQTFDVEKIGKLIPSITSKLYDRPQMADYEYLKDDVEPPFWLLVTCFILSILLSIGLTIYFHKVEV